MYRSFVKLKPCKSALSVVLILKRVEYIHSKVNRKTQISEMPTR